MSTCLLTAAILHDVGKLERTFATSAPLATPRRVSFLGPTFVMGAGKPSRVAIDKIPRFPRAAKNGRAAPASSPITAQYEFGSPSLPHDSRSHGPSTTLDDLELQAGPARPRPP